MLKVTTQLDNLFMSIYWKIEVYINNVDYNSIRQTFYTKLLKHIVVHKDSTLIL